MEYGTSLSFAKPEPPPGTVADLLNNAGRARIAERGRARKYGDLAFHWSLLTLGVEGRCVQTVELQANVTFEDVVMFTTAALAMGGVCRLRTALPSRQPQ